ncbi:MAG: cation-translocating P-type ATPase [Planctomycetota bacterium]
MEPNEAASPTLTILGMTCQACAGAVERALRQVEGVVTADVSYATSSARIVTRRRVEEAALAAAVGHAGYRLLVGGSSLAERVRDLGAGEERELRRLALEAGVAGAALALVLAGMLLGPWPGVLPLAAVIAVAGAGGRTLVRGLRALARAAPDMNSLVALGTGAALIAGLLTHDHTHLHAAVMIAAFVLFGRWLEGRTKRRVGTAVERLFDLAPPFARVLRRGQEVEVPLAEVAVGNLVTVRPGERVPVDGDVISGRSEIDTALLTGESTPRAVAPGDRVIAGALNGTGAFSLRATGIGANSTLERIATAIHAAQASRAPAQRLADRLAAVFVPIVLAVAALGLGAAWLRGAPVGDAVAIAVAVLVVACPCALGLATPIAILAATDRAARAGFLVREAAVFETLGDVDVVVFDKTGTLSRGAPELESVVVLDGGRDDEWLALAAGAEAHSEQPFGRAVVRAARERSLQAPVCTEFEALPGRGVRTTVAGRVVEILRPSEVPELALRVAKIAASGASPVVLVVDGRPRALLAFRDPPHERARPVVAALAARGLAIEIVSGDDPNTVAAFAHELGIARHVGGATPEDKAAHVVSLRAAAARVLFVGDGVNDAPALVAADVGLAQGRGADVAIEAADVAWLESGVPDVQELLELAYETRRAIRQNLSWAFSYNLLALPLASGLLAPWIPWTPSPALAALAMAGSSLVVVGNGYRLARRR